MDIRELEAAIKKMDEEEGPPFHPKQDVKRSMLRASLEIAYQLAIHNARELGNQGSGPFLTERQ